jgi:hypothetical protein
VIICATVRVVRLHRLVVGVSGLLAVFGGAVVVRLPPAGAAGGTPLLGKKIIGYSVRHRPIVAYHLGDPRLRPTLILGQMHGDEHAGVLVARSIVRARVSVEGLNLWVVPTLNPDGDVAHTRQNAHHVDLNRNWPHRWRPLTGTYYSGRKPLSEPETRAVWRFLRQLRPKYLVSLHQPLDGVDTTDGGALDPAFRNRLARNLGLPRKAFRCWSTCHGSMTGWYTARHYGVAVTVEFGAHPSSAFLTGRARRGIVTAMGGHFGSLAAHDPRSSVSGTAAASGAIRLRGWAYDVDARGTSLRYTLYRDGRRVGTGIANRPSAALNRRHALTGRHGLTLDDEASSGRHLYCLTFRNLGAGTRDPRRCVSVTVPSATPTPTPSASTTSAGP